MAAEKGPDKPPGEDTVVDPLTACCAVARPLPLARSRSSTRSTSQLYASAQMSMQWHLHGSIAAHSAAPGLQFEHQLRSVQSHPIARLGPALSPHQRGVSSITIERKAGGRQSAGAVEPVRSAASAGDLRTTACPWPWSNYPGSAAAAGCLQTRHLGANSSGFSKLTKVGCHRGTREVHRASDTAAGRKVRLQMQAKQAAALPCDNHARHRV